MTGQVKEEIISRFGELGVRVRQGTVAFQPCLLRHREFLAGSRDFRFLDIDGNWQTLPVPAHGLAFTWCQVPVLYRIDDASGPELRVDYQDGKQDTSSQLELSADDSAAVFQRNGRIRQITVAVRSADLFSK